jgi:hypothetical protein
LQVKYFLLYIGYKDSLIAKADECNYNNIRIFDLGSQRKKGYASVDESFCKLKYNKVINKIGFN